MKKLKVKVTQDDINKGIPGITTACPIALAVKNATDLWDVHVGTKRMRLTKGRPKTGYRVIALSLPTKARKFVLNFDHGGLCSPFEFTAHAVKNRGE